jgi:hypothetical protein
MYTLLNTDWMAEARGKCSRELCIAATGMKAFQSFYSCLMPDGLCSTLFVLVDVGILCLAGKQRQRLRGLE